MTLDVEVLTGDDALRALDKFRPVYAEVYGEPPYLEKPSDVEEFVAGWEHRASSTGFRLVLARVDGEVIGFTFGHELAPGTRWWDGALSPFPEGFTDEWPGRTFAIIELAIRKPHRRQGIGRRLHDQLLDGVRAERVTLLVRPEPEADPARAAYDSWGYSKVGQIRPAPTLPLYDALVRNEA
jgi:ribosomal protein S18 acetylase RimI-like enzyme